MAENGVFWSQNFWAGNDFCISNSPSKMTKPEVLGILGLDVGDNWAQGCLLEVYGLFLDQVSVIWSHFKV